MPPSTQPGPLEALPHRRRVNWDPTINLGHILTASAMLVAGFGAWNALDKRVAALETATSMSDRHQRERDSAQDQRIKETVDDIKQTAREIKQSIDELRRERGK